MLACADGLRGDAHCVLHIDVAIGEFDLEGFAAGRQPVHHLPRVVVAPHSDCRHLPSSGGHARTGFARGKLEDGAFRISRGATGACSTAVWDASCPCPKGSSFMGRNMGTLRMVEKIIDISTAIGGPRLRHHPSPIAPEDLIFQSSPARAAPADAPSKRRCRHRAATRYPSIVEQDPWPRRRPPTSASPRPYKSGPHWGNFLFSATAKKSSAVSRTGDRYLRSVLLTSRVLRLSSVGPPLTRSGHQASLRRAPRGEASRI